MKGALGEIDGFDELGDDGDVETRALLLHAVHEFGAENGLGEAGKIFDVGRDHQLAAHHDAAEEERVEVGAGGVDGGGVAGGAGADDDDFFVVGHNEIITIWVGDDGGAPLPDAQRL